MTSARDQMFAKVVLDSISPQGIRLTTVHAHYPRIIHSEIMTHRVFSRNARSSRAVPVKTILQEVRDNPFVPWHWGKNQKGMQATEECDEIVWSQAALMPLDGYAYGHSLDWKGTEVEKTGVTREDAWLIAAERAVQVAAAFADAGYHKQIANRLLEPFSWIDTLITSTSWANFYTLRDHEDAEPHFHDLAAMVREARDHTSPQILQPGMWHIPFVTDLEQNTLPLDVQKKLSTARCARISYRPFDGNANIEAEIARHDALVAAQPLHASPAEHQATPDKWNNRVIFDDDGHWIGSDHEWEHPKLHGNFDGWIQYRKTLPGEYVHD